MSSDETEGGAKEMAQHQRILASHSPSLVPGIQITAHNHL